MAQMAREFPLIDLKAETAKFRDHTFSTARSDWPATWRNWIRNAKPPARASPDKADKKTAEMRAWFGSAFQNPPKDDDAVTFALR